MKAAMKEEALPPLPTLREAGAACAAFARAEFAAQEQGDNSGRWFAAYEGTATAALSLPVTSMDEVMILTALVHGAVSEMSEQLQVALLKAPKEEERSAQDLGDRIEGALKVIVQALSDLNGTPIEAAAADYDWCFRLDDRKRAEGAP